jgi:hypothetical protein
MLLATIGGLVITPYLYYLVQTLSDRLGSRKAPSEAKPAEAGVES